MLDVFLVLVDPVAMVNPLPSVESTTDMVWRWSWGHMSPWMYPAVIVALMLNLLTISGMTRASTQSCGSTSGRSRIASASSRDGGAARVLPKAVWHGVWVGMSVRGHTWTWPTVLWMTTHGAAGVVEWDTGRGGE